MPGQWSGLGGEQPLGIELPVEAAQVREAASEERKSRLKMGGDL